MIIPVILCGGAGARLWPLSYERAPKQFLPLVGDQPTFSMTLERVANPAVFERPLIVTNAAQRFWVAEALDAAGVDAELLLEPARRDTAVAIAAAADLIAGRDADALMLVLAADHLVKDVAGFQATVALARKAAEADRIVTFGIVADTPATRYGYIRKGALLPDLPGVSIVAAFNEKPDAETAKRYVADGYLWNSGNFLMRAALGVAEIERHAKAVADAAREAVAGIETIQGGLRLAALPYRNAPSLSFDYAVMEKTEQAAVVEADFDWCDIGSWESLCEIAGTDAAGNTLIGNVVAHESSNSYVNAVAGQVALLGVENLVIAASADGLLVAARDKLDSVRSLVAAVDESNSESPQETDHVVAPWGYFQVLDGGEGYKVKRLVVEPGARLSLQKHAHRAEHWVVVSGIADATIGSKTERLGENQSTFIPRGGVHRLANPGDKLLTVIEVQYGDYLGDDDIERFDDDYARLDEN